MRHNKTLIYWDACIFLAWLKNEPNDKSIIDGMQDTAQKVDNNLINLMTSVVTRTEVLESRFSKTQIKKFDALFDRPNVEMVILDHRISDLSHEIRSFYDKKGIVLSTNDCHHLATAIQYGADEFNTLDGSGKKKKGTLLPLNGIIADKYPLKICVPFVVQSSLF